MVGLMATAEIDISAEPERVWQALVDPDQIKQYMFGSEVVTDWQPGSSIVWTGEYEVGRTRTRGRYCRSNRIGARRRGAQPLA
jgi:uncharacterized protein YndB with AHSA1/START domain